MRKEKGFSFIELIVVVTIILVVTVAGTVSYQAASRKSRDSRRMSDLQKMAIALEVYKQAVGTYPPDVAGLPSGLAPTYIQVLPTDPKSTFRYYYTTGAGYYSYSLFAQVEDTSSVNYSTPTVSSCGGNCNYRIVSP